MDSAMSEDSPIVRPLTIDVNASISRLRVEQGPIRARMCGFGDKVRLNSTC